MTAEQTKIRDDISQEIIASAGKLAKQSPDKITVRDVLKDLNITNRVFYNRFHNIDEVLEIIYLDMVHKVRESLATPWQEGTDFFEHVIEVASRTLVLSYDHKDNLSQFVFENDSAGSYNFNWWCDEIKKLIALGQSRGLLKPGVDPDMLSYSIWCFIRGFNADALARNLSEEEAMKRFTYGFGVFLDGIRA